MVLPYGAVLKLTSVSDTDMVVEEVWRSAFPFTGYIASNMVFLFIFGVAE